MIGPSDARSKPIQGIATRCLSTCKPETSLLAIMMSPSLRTTRSILAEFLDCVFKNTEMSGRRALHGNRRIVVVGFGFSVPRTALYDDSFINHRRLRVR